MADAIIVINAGSSTLKFSVFQIETDDTVLLLRGLLEGLNTTPRLSVRDANREVIEERTWQTGQRMSHGAAIGVMLDWGRDRFLNRHRVIAVGHRVVHGGVKYSSPVRVSDDVLNKLEELVPLAPLHQPKNLAAIRALHEFLPGAPQIACFDTAFHRERPEVEQICALPRHLTESGIRRYGFHGLSYEFIASVLPEYDRVAAEGRTVVAHLGNGASMCALLAGKSVATTMSFTALDGLPMGTRSGAVDPGVLLYLMEQYKMGHKELEQLLYRESGLRGVSGISHDMRQLLQSDDPKAAEAIELYVYRISRELGSLAAALGGLDSLVFTGGIGQNAAPVRAAVGAGAGWLGLEFDDEANNRNGPRLSTPDSRVTAWVIPTNEELMIARHARSVIDESAADVTK